MGYPLLRERTLLVILYSFLKEECLFSSPNLRDTSRPLGEGGAAFVFIRGAGGQHDGVLDVALKGKGIMGRRRRGSGVTGRLLHALHLAHKKYLNL